MDITARLEQVFHQMFGGADPPSANPQKISKNSEDQIAGSEPGGVEDPNLKVANLNEIFDDLC